MCKMLAIQLFSFFAIFEHVVFSKRFAIQDRPDIEICLRKIGDVPFPHVYKGFYTDCTHYFGTVEIAEPFELLEIPTFNHSAALKFISKIQFIQGSLRIKNLKVDSIELPSLVKINYRGYDEKGKAFSFLNNVLKYLSIPNLEEIYGSSEIAGIYPSYFSQLDLTPITHNTAGGFSKQNLKTFKSSDTPNCQKECTSGSFWPSPKCYCVKKIDTQKRKHLIITDQTDFMCLVRNELDECSVCLGGLRLQDGLCVKECQKWRYLFLDTFCLDECPENTFKMINQYNIRTCELSCPKDHVLSADRICIPCSDSSCTERYRCSYLRGKSSKDTYNISEVLSKIDTNNCSIFYGELNLASHTLKELGHHVVEKLQVLKKVQVIYGALLIDFHDGLMPLIKNLTFLENLGKIYFDQQATHLFTSLDLDLRNSSIQYLGLRSLEYVDSDKGIDLHVDSEPNHCFVNPFCRNPKSFVLNPKLFNDSSCEALAKHCACHEACASKHGCWGPGPTQCFACCDFRAGSKCVKSCAEETGYYQPPGTMSANLCSLGVSNTFNNDMHCVKCHEECSAGCSGAGANRCTGGCRHFSDQGVCVSKCPSNKFADEASVCQECSAHCKNGCSGSGNWAGDGGCHECIVLLPDKLTCASNCPLGTYSTTMNKTVSCSPCHDNCGACIDNGSSRQSCIKCKFAFLNDSCVSECPGNFFTKPLDDGNRVCSECHPQCFGGCSDFGPSFCLYCRHKALVFANRTMCVESCSLKGVQALEEEGFYCKDASALLIYLMVGSLGLLMVVVACAIYVYAKLRQQKRVRQAIIDLYTNISKPEPGTQVVEPNMSRLVMINWNDLKLDRYKPLGSGAFGVVYKGWWRVPKSGGVNQNMRISVAIKSFRSATKEPSQNGNAAPCAKYDELLEEAKVMASVEHEHCLRIIGLCVNKDAPCLVSKLLPLGSLDSWIRSNRRSITSAHMLTWAKQIAAGMEYLGQRKIIHRDLAARNVLLLKENHIQISDFGLAKMLEHVHGDSVVIKTGQVPIRWLALETIQTGQYSFKSDIWSYGITLWEIFTFAEKPYQNLTTDEIKPFLLTGKRLHKPDTCSIDVFLLMNQCWMTEPNKRPSFEQCKTRFDYFLHYAQHYLTVDEGRVLYRKPMSASSTASPYSLVNPNDYLTPSVKGSSYSSLKEGLVPHSPGTKSFLSQSSFSEFGFDLSRKELLPVARKGKKARSKISKISRFLDMIKGTSYTRRRVIDPPNFEDMNRDAAQPMLVYVKPPELQRNNSYMTSESLSSTGTAETDYLSSTPSTASAKLPSHLASWLSVQAPMEEVAEESDDYLKPSELPESETSI